MKKKTTKKQKKKNNRITTPIKPMDNNNSNASTAYSLGANMANTKARFHVTNNTELNDLRKMICLRKTYVSFDIIPVYKATETLVEHRRHGLADSVCHAPQFFQ